MDVFLQQLANGLFLGCVYALIALGYTMVYGILELINFAHGDVFMVGSYVGLAMVSVLALTGLTGAPYVIALIGVFLAAMVFCATLAVTIEQVAYRPLRDGTRLPVYTLMVALALWLPSVLVPQLAFLKWAALLPMAVLAGMAWMALMGRAVGKGMTRDLGLAARLAPLLTAIGMSIVLQESVRIIAGPQPYSFPESFPTGTVTIIQPVGDNTGVSLSMLQVFIVGVSIALMASLTLLVRYSRLGKAMRATAQSMQTAKLMGINVQRIISITFFIGAALAGAGGVMWGMHYGQIDFSIGFLAGMKAFTAAVLGGIGNIPGAMVGGLLLGVLEALGAGYISAEWKDVIAFGVLILVLLFKPSGLLGEQVPEKA